MPANVLSTLVWILELSLSFVILNHKWLLESVNTLNRHEETPIQEIKCSLKESGQKEGQHLEEETNVEGN